MCDRLTAGVSHASYQESACHFSMGSRQPLAARAALEQYPYHRGYLTHTQGTRAPVFSGGEGARVDLDSELRPCFERSPAGDVHSLRNWKTPMSLTFTPQHYEWQQPDNLAKLQKDPRIEHAKCHFEPATQKRFI